jgi:prepilin-type processing-associated H-X9-DG protein/prepilin-type N-terminal cleavage/methylation domain-containing protein
MRATHINPGPNAFTLVELLVVTGILAILAVLSASVLSGAKARAKTAQCVGNLHQYGIALNQFLADYSEYPLFMNPGYLREGKHAHHKTGFEVALFPSLFSAEGSEVPKLDPDNPPGVFVCPAAKRHNGWPVNLGFSHYGYNSDGLIGGPTDGPLGLGGLGGEDHHAPPVPESLVRVPSDMLAIGDGFHGWGPVIQEGGSKIGRRFTAQENYDSTRRAYKRHGGKLNFVYCDGHVDALRVDYLFADTTDAALRKWNTDNEPHRERIAE